MGAAPGSREAGRDDPVQADRTTSNAQRTEVERRTIRRRAASRIHFACRVAGAGARRPPARLVRAVLLVDHHVAVLRHAAVLDQGVGVLPPGEQLDHDAERVLDLLADADPVDGLDVHEEPLVAAEAIGRVQEGLRIAVGWRVVGVGGHVLREVGALNRDRLAVKIIATVRINVTLLPISFSP